MSTSQTPPRTRKIHKRLIDSGADQSCFLHTFPKQAKTVHPPTDPPMDTLPQDQHTGSSHRYSDPQESAQPSGALVASALGQTAHANQYSGQPVSTLPASNVYYAQPRNNASMHGTVYSSVVAAGQGTNPVHSPTLPPLHHLYGESLMSAPRNTESRFDGFNAGNFYESVPQVYPQGQPHVCPWVQDFFTPSPHHDMGTMEHGQLMESQHYVPIEDRSSGSLSNHMQQDPYHHSSSQYPPMYGAPGHVISSAAARSRYPPPSDSPGSGSDSTN